MQIPSNLLTDFDSMLTKKSILEKYRMHYRKWLRFYLDFCRKYDRSTATAESLVHFLQKLREKRQQTCQLRQAEDAVRIFDEIVEEKRIGNSRHAGKPGPSTTARPHTDVRNETKERQLSAGGCGVREFEGNTANDPPDRLYGKVEKREPGNPFDNPAKNRIGLVETGTDWRPAFDGLRSQVKVRHYSPKTLKTYAPWLGKFQAFTKSKPLEKLGDKDITDFITFLAVKRNVAASTQN